MEVTDETADKKKKSKRKTGKDAKESKEVPTKKILVVEDGTNLPLTGIGIYFIRTSTKRTLGYVKPIRSRYSMIGSGNNGTKRTMRKRPQTFFRKVLLHVHKRLQYRLKRSEGSRKPSNLTRNSAYFLGSRNELGLNLSLGPFTPRN